MLKDTINTLSQMIEDGNLIHIVYIRKTPPAIIVHRKVEPYELKGPFFWAWCRMHNKIHKFYIKNVRNVSQTREKFHLRFPTKVFGRDV